MMHVQSSLNFIRLLRVIITPLLRGENDSKQSDEFQAMGRAVVLLLKPIIVLLCCHFQGCHGCLNSLILGTDFFTRLLI